MLKHSFAILVCLSFGQFFPIDKVDSKSTQSIGGGYDTELASTSKRPKIENKNSEDSNEVFETVCKSDCTITPYKKKENNYVRAMLNPPNCTTLSFPLGNETDISASLGLITWNSVSNANTYRITVRGSESSLNDVTDLVITGISYSFNNSFTLGETVSVTVVPFNNDGNAIGCNTETFTIISLEENLPTCTTLTVPVNGAVNIPVDISFSWNEVPDAAGYLITVITDMDEVLLAETDVGFFTSFKLPEDMPFATTILVAVTPYNSDENFVSCLFSRFTTQEGPETEIPACTTINSPVEGGSNVPVTTDIRWNAVSGDIEGYILNIGTTENGKDILDNADVGLSNSYELFQNLPFNQTIFVTVIPYQGALNAENCASQSFMTVTREVEVEETDKTLYGFSPNGDNINDFWVIKDIELVPDNIVSVYNRWGDMVFQVQGYDNTSNVFRGRANKRTKIGANELPSGTYFFNIQSPEQDTLKKLQGYLVLKR